MTNRDDYFSQVVDVNYDGDVVQEWNNPKGYNTKGVGDNLEQSGFGGWLGDLWNDYTGLTAQQREFAQQEYLQDKMNEYNTPAAQMARMKAAGINPNLAASGIAGSGSESAQAPAVSSNTGGTAAALGSLSSLISSGSEAALVEKQKENLSAQSRNLDAQTNRTDTLLDYEVGKFQADTAKTWIDAGMDKHMADYWSVKASYADRQEWLDVQGKLWSINKVQQDILNLEEDYKIKQQQVEIEKQHLAQEEYKTAIIANDKYFSDERKRIYKAVGVDPDQSEDGMLIEAYANGHQDLLLDAYRAKAKVQTAGSLEATREQLREQLQIEYQERLEFYKQQLLNDKEFQEELIKIGVRADAMKGVLNLIFRRLPGASGVTIKAGPVGVNSDPVSIR